jgi:hypothetical protein
MGDSDNKRSWSMRKGWIGYVRADWDAIRKNWDDVDWTTGPKPKEEKKDEMGKIIQKW